MNRDFDVLDPERERNVLEAVKSVFCGSFTSKKRFKQSLNEFFPILDWLPNYNFEEYLLSDLMAGITAGVIHVTQGIAYAILCGVPPVTGLYMSALAPLIYMFFGTSRTTSLGSFAVISLMTGDANEEIMEKYYPLNSSDIFDLDDYSELLINPSTICSTITFTVGVIQLTAAILKFKYLTNLFTLPLIGGFSTAAVVHIFFTQIFDILGVRVKKTTGPFYLLGTFWKFLKAIPKTNLVTLATSLVTALILIVGKDHISPIVKKKTKGRLVVPFELIVLILGTWISYLFEFRNKHGVRIVGRIPTELPTPQLPVLSLVPDCISYAIPITILTVAIHISTAKVLAKQQNYPIDDGQEIYAIGFSSVFSSFFPVYPNSNGFGRSFVQAECGARTQLCSFFSSAFLFCVILFLGPWIRTLPRCVLSTVIIISMRAILEKVGEVKLFWQVSKIDLSIWIVSFVGSVVVDVVYGLVIALVYTLATVVFRTQWPRWNSRISRPIILSDGRTVKRICIFEFESLLLFTNAENFKRAVNETLAKTVDGIPGLWDANKIQFYFIFDCSAITEIDSTGLLAIQDVIADIRRRTKSIVCFVNAREPIQNLLLKRQIATIDDFFSTVESVVQKVTFQ